MKKLLITILLLGMAGNAGAAELLVQAKAHWMDSLTQAEVDLMDEGALASYKARSQKGDIIVVRPDGWAWGKEEGLPNYIVVKVPGITVANATKYEESLYETFTDKNGQQQQRVVRNRKNSFSPFQVEIAKTGNLSTISLNKTATLNYISVKNGAASEIIAPKADLISYLEYRTRGLRKKVIAALAPVLPAYAATLLEKTVMPSGGDYTSLAACVTAQAQNLVTADKYLEIKIDGTWSSADTTAVSGSFTTSTTCYLKIYTTATARHHGVYSTSHYLLYPSTDSMPLNITMNTDTSKATIDGLQIDGRNKTGTAGEGNGGCIHTNNYAANITVTNNLIRSKSYSGIDIPNVRGSGSLIANNIVYDTDKAAYSNGISFDNGGNYGMKVYNNTVYGFYRALYREDADTKNNIIMNAGSVAIYGTLTSGNNNATYDGTGDDSPLTSGMVNYTTYADYFVSVTAGSEDFHLKAGSPFIGQGADLGASYNTDIDGDTRSGTWDIGADEYAAGAPASKFPVPAIWWMNN